MMEIHLEKTSTNITKVVLGNLCLFFSFKTLVAFGVSKKLFVSENAWTQTTGKHLTQIDGGDRAARIPNEQWEKYARMAIPLLFNREFPLTFRCPCENGRHRTCEMSVEDMQEAGWPICDDCGDDMVVMGDEGLFR